MNKHVSAQEVWETAKELGTKIREASWSDRDKPVCQYPWVAGFMESLLKNLPPSKENYNYLRSELRHLNNYLAERG